MPGRPRTVALAETTRTAAISSHRTVRGWKIRCRITGIGVVVSQFSEAFATDTTLVPEREVSMAAGPRPPVEWPESGGVPGWSITVMPWFVTRGTGFPKMPPAEPREQIAEWSRTTRWPRSRRPEVIGRVRRGPRLVVHADASVRDPRDGVPGALTGGAAGVARGIGAADAVAPELRAGDAVAEADAVLAAAVDSVVGDLHLLRGA